MIIVAIIIFLVIVGLVTAAIGVAASRKEEQPQNRLLRMHAEYMANAAKASRRGHEGEANVWFEGAKNLWAHKEEKKTLPEAKHVVGRQLTYGDVRDRIPEHLLRRAEAATKKHLT